VTSVADLLVAHGDDDVCRLQTIGRRTGRPRTIEIWFATDGRRVYLLAGGRERAHWVRNIAADPRVRLRIGGRTVAGRARAIEGEANEPIARRLLAGKYQDWSPGRPLSSWAATALPVQIDLD